MYFSRSIFRSPICSSDRYLLAMRRNNANSPTHQHFRTDRLGEVIISAGFQSLDLRGFVAQAKKNDECFAESGFACAAGCTLRYRFYRASDINCYDQVRLKRLASPRASVFFAAYLYTLLLQGCMRCLEDIRFVIGNQYFFYVIGRTHIGCKNSLYLLLAMNKGITEVLSNC